MQLIVSPARLKGKVNCNNSKTQLLRLLIIAAQLKDSLTIYNPTYSDDVNNLINALLVFGVEITTNKKYLKVNANNFSYNGEALFCGDSGAVARFLIPFCLLYFKECNLVCSQRLIERLTPDLNKFIEQYDITMKINADKLYLKGALNVETIKIDTTISSQLASGFALVIPFLSGMTKKIYLHGNSSKSYFLYTLSILKLFNIRFIEEYDDLYLYQKDMIVNPQKLGQVVDYSNLIYYLILTLKYDINITNYLLPSTQPDYAIFDYFNKLGVSYFLDNKHILLNFIPTHDLNLDMEQNPDLVIPLVILALYFNNDIEFKNIKRLTYKESNRLEAIITMLNKINQRYEFDNETLKIYKTLDRNFDNLELDAEADHRLIMGYVTLAYLFEREIKITNADNVAKSAPNFIANFSRLGAKFKWI